MEKTKRVEAFGWRIFETSCSKVENLLLTKLLKVTKPCDSSCSGWGASGSSRWPGRSPSRPSCPPQRRESPSSPHAAPQAAPRHDNYASICWRPEAPPRQESGSISALFYCDIAGFGFWVVFERQFQEKFF